jgi:uncharacterized protein with PQ loop repeat
MFTSIPQFLGTAATAYGVLAALSVLLQARQMLTRRDSCEVSLRFLASYAGGYAIWLLYGLSVGNVPLIVVDTVGLFCAGLTLVAALSLRGSLVHPASWANCTTPAVPQGSPRFAQRPSRRPWHARHARGGGRSSSLAASGEGTRHRPDQAGRDGYSHLPADLQDGIAAYDARVASGAIQFDAEGFAVHQPDVKGGWIASNLQAHLSLLDLWPPAGHASRPAAPGPEPARSCTVYGGGIEEGLDGRPGPCLTHTEGAGR